MFFAIFVADITIFRCRIYKIVEYHILPRNGVSRFKNTIASIVLKYFNKYKSLRPLRLCVRNSILLSFYPRPFELMALRAVPASTWLGARSTRTAPARGVRQASGRLTRSTRRHEVTEMVLRLAYTWFHPHFVHLGSLFLSRNTQERPSGDTEEDCGRICFVQTNLFSLIQIRHEVIKMCASLLSKLLRVFVSLCTPC